MDDAGVADEVVGRGGDFLPAAGFGGFGFKFGDGFDRVAGGDYFRSDAGPKTPGWNKSALPVCAEVILLCL